MSILTMTAESLTAQLGEPVAEMLVVIAKNSVVGLDTAAISELLGVDPSEVQELQADSTYKAVRLLIASEYAKAQVETDFGWDDIEREALTRLAKRVSLETDSEMLLKFASVANKAQRRNMPNQNRVLDPAAGGSRVPLTLTSRIVKRLNSATGEQEVEETRQISVMDGSAKNPTFEDIDSLLGVTRRPALPAKMVIHTHDADFDLDDVEFKR